MAEIWGAALIAGGAVAGGLIAANGAQSAASTQAGAAENAQQISLNEFNTITQQEQPFMNLGYGAAGDLGYLLGLPGYQNYGSAPSGGTLSGITQPGAGLGPGSMHAMSPNQKLQGYDPGSGYQIGPGGSISQMLPGGSGPDGSSSRPSPVTAPGLLNQFSSTPANTGPAPRPGAPAPAGAAGAAGNPAGGYGSLVTPFTAQNWQQLSPMYNFDVQQGRQGVLNADASQQGALSGAAAKDLINYNQAAANQSFGQAFNQYQTQQGNIFSRLSGIAQLGQNAAANTGMQGTQLAGQAAQSATNVGTALAGGQVGAANAYSGAISSAIPWIYQASQGQGMAPSADDYATI